MQCPRVRHCECKFEAFLVHLCLDFATLFSPHLNKTSNTDFALHVYEHIRHESNQPLCARSWPIQFQHGEIHVHFKPIPRSTSRAATLSTRASTVKTNVRACRRMFTIMKSMRMGTIRGLPIRHCAIGLASSLSPKNFISPSGRLGASITNSVGSSDGNDSRKLVRH